MVRVFIQGPASLHGAVHSDREAESTERTYVHCSCVAICIAGTSTVIAMATEELGKVYSRVQPIKSSCLVPPDTTHELLEVIRAVVPDVTGTSDLGAPLAMDFSMADGVPASHNESCVHSWLQETVEAD
jgi:hypothetical protein